MSRNTSRRHSSPIKGPLNVNAPIPPRLRGSPLLAQANAIVPTTSKAKPSPLSSSYTYTPWRSVAGADGMDENIPHVPQAGTGTATGPWLDFAELPTPPQALSFAATNSGSTLLHHHYRPTSSMTVHYTLPAPSPAVTFRAPTPIPDSYPHHVKAPSAASSSFSSSSSSSSSSSHLATPMPLPAFSSNSPTNANNPVQLAGSAPSAYNNDDEPSEGAGGYFA